MCAFLDMYLPYYEGDLYFFVHVYIKVFFVAQFDFLNVKSLQTNIQIQTEFYYQFLLVWTVNSNR